MDADMEDVAEDVTEADLAIHQIVVAEVAVAEVVVAESSKLLHRMEMVAESSKLLHRMDMVAVADTDLAVAAVAHLAVAVVVAPYAAEGQAWRLHFSTRVVADA